MKTPAQVIHTLQLYAYVRQVAYPRRCETKCFGHVCACRSEEVGEWGEGNYIRKNFYLTQIKAVKIFNRIFLRLSKTVQNLAHTVNFENNFRVRTKYFAIRAYIFKKA
jgi:hypothetical protein